MDLDKIYETIHLYASSESDSDYDGLDDFDDEYLKNRPNPIAIEEITKKLVVITPGGAGTVNKEPNDSTLSVVQEPLCYLTDRSPSELTSDEFATLNAALEALGQYAGVTVEISRDDSKIDVVLKMLNLLKHLNGLGKVGRGFYDVLDILGMQPVYFVVDEDSLKDIATWLQSINLKITWGNFSMDQDDGCNIINNLRLMYHYLEETPKSKLVKQVLDSLVEVYENVGKFVDATSIGDITEDEVCEEYSVLLNMLKSINNKTVLGTFFSDSEDVVQIKADMEDIYELILAIDDGYLKHRMVKIFLETYNNFARLILGKYLWVLKDCPNVESLDIVENCTGVEDMEVTKNHPKVNVSGNHIKLFEKKAKSIMEKKNSKNLDYDLWLCLDDIAKEKIQSSINQYKKEYNIDINIYTDSFEMLKKKLNDFNNTVRKVGDKQLIQLHMKLKMSIKTKIWWCALNKLLMGNRPKFFNYFLFKDHQKKTLNNHLKIINNVTGINVDVLSDSYEVFVKKLEDIELRLKDFPAHLSTFYLLKDELDKVPNTISKMYSDCAHNSVKNPKTQIVSKKNVYPNFEYLTVGQKNNIQNMLREISKVAQCKLDVNSSYDKFVTNMTSLKNFVGNMGSSETKVNYLKRITNVENSLRNSEGKVPVQTDVYPNFKSLTKGQKQNIQQMLQAIMDETKCTVDINKNDHATFIANFQRMKHSVQMMKQSNEKQVYLRRLKDVEKKLGGIKAGVTIANLSGCTSVESLNSCGITTNQHLDFKSLSAGQKQNIQQMLQKIMDVTKCTFNIKKCDHITFIVKFQRLKHCVEMMKQSNEKLIYLKRLEDVEHKLGGIYSGVTIANLSGCTSVESLDNCGVSENLYQNDLSLKQKQNIQLMWIDATYNIKKCDHKTLVANFERMKHCMQTIKPSIENDVFLDRLKEVEQILGRIKPNCGVSENLYPNFESLTKGQKHNIQQMLQKIVDLTKCTLDVNKSDHATFVANFQHMKHSVQMMKQSNEKQVYLKRLKDVEQKLGGIKTGGTQGTIANLSECTSVESLNNCGITTNQHLDFKSLSAGQKQNIQQMLQKIMEVTKCTFNIKKCDHITFIVKFQRLKHCVEMMKQSNEKLIYLKRLEDVEHKLGGIYSGVTIANLSGCTSVESLDNCGVSENLYQNNLSLEQKQNIQLMWIDVTYNIKKCDHKTLVANFERMKHCMQTIKPSIENDVFLDRLKEVEQILGRIKPNCGVSENLYPNFESLTKGQKHNIQQMLQKIVDVTKCTLDVNKSDHATFVANFQHMKHSVQMMKQSNEKQVYLKRLKDVEQKLGGIKTGGTQGTIANLSECTSVESLNNCGITTNQHLDFKSLSAGQKQNIQQMLQKIMEVTKCTFNIKKCDHITFIVKFQRLKHCVEMMKQSNEKLIYLKRLEDVEHKLGGIYSGVTIANLSGCTSVESLDNCGVSENLYQNDLSLKQKQNIQLMWIDATYNIKKCDHKTLVANFERMKHCMQTIKPSIENDVFLDRLKEVEQILGRIKPNCGVSENLYPNFESLTKGQKHNIQQMLQKIVDETKCTLDINKNDYAKFVANFKRLKHCVQMMKQSNKKLSYLMRLEDVERKLGVIKTGVPRGTIANLSGCTSVESLDNCELSENLYQNFKPVERLYPNFYTLTEGDKQRIEELLKEINKATNTKVTVNSSLREFSDGMVEIKSLVGNMEFTFSKYVCLNNIENIERILDQCNVNWAIKRTELQKTTAVVHHPDNQVIGDRTVNRIKICDTTTADYNSVSRQENTVNFVENVDGIVKRVDKVVRQQNNDNYIENVHGKDNIDQLHNNGNYIENLVLNQENKVVDQLQNNDNHIYTKQQNIQGILNDDNHNNVSTILYMSEKSFKSYKSLTQSDADNINSLLKEIDQHIAIQVNRDDYFTFLTSLNVLIDKVRAMETSAQKTKYLQNLTTVEQKICKVSTTNQFKLRNGAIVEKSAPIVEKNAPIVDKEAAILELTPNQKMYISNCLGDINRVIKIKSDINIDSDTYFGFLSKFHVIKRNVDKMLQTNQKKIFVRDITVIEHLLGLGAGGKSAHLKHPQHEELRQEEKREQQRNEQECDEEQQQEVEQHELQQQLTQKHKQLEQKHEQQQLEHKRKGQQLEQQQELKHEKQQHEQQQQESKEQLTQTHAQQQHEQKHEEQQNEQQQQELKREEQPQELEHENHQQEQKHEQQRHEQKHEEQQNEQQQEEPKHEEQPQELEHEKQQPKPEQQQKHQDFLLFQYYNLNKSQRKYINTLCKTVDANLDVTKDDYFTFIKKLTASNSFFLDAVRNTLRNVKIPSASSNLDPSVTQREVIQHKLIKLNAILPINVLDFSELNSNMITIKTMLKNDTIITQSNKIMVAKYVAEIDEILTNKQPPKTSIALLFIRYRNFLSSDDLSPEDFTNESTVQTKKINDIILLNTINKFGCKIETVEGLCNQFYMISRIIEDKINNSPGGLDLLWIGFNSLKSAFVDEIEESKTFLSCLSKNPCRKTERRVLQNLAVLNETLDHMREFQEKFPNKYVGKLR